MPLDRTDVIFGSSTPLQQADVVIGTVDETGLPPIPANALLDDDGAPLFDDDGTFLLDG